MKIKKSLFIYAITAVMVLSMLTGVVFSEGISKYIEVSVNAINVEVNGQAVESDNLLYEGRTYVQLKEICEILGKDLQ